MIDQKDLLTVALHRGTADGIFAFYTTLVKGKELLQLNDKQLDTLRIIAESQLNTIEVALELKLKNNADERIFLENFPKIVENKN